MYDLTLAIPRTDKNRWRLIALGIINLNTTPFKITCVISCNPDLNILDLYRCFDGLLIVA